MTNNFDYLFKDITLEDLTTKMPRLKHYITNRERLNFLIAKREKCFLSKSELSAYNELKPYCEGIESMFN